MSSAVASRRRSSLRHLVLVGGGPAHMFVLRQLAQARPGDLNISLVAAPRTLYQPMLAHCLSGEEEVESMDMPLTDLSQACQARLHDSPCRSLSGARGVLQLSDGQELPFDLLSLDLEAQMGRARIDLEMPGARQHALFLHPLRQFVQLWPRLLELASQRAIHLVVVGGGLRGFELVTAAVSALREPHGSRVSWVLQGQAEQLFPQTGLRAAIEAVLRQMSVTILPAHCVGVGPSEVLLDNGASLHCDAPLLAGPISAPEWLRQSDLALDGEGRVLVDGRGRSHSHPQILVANEFASQGTLPGTSAWNYPDREPRSLLRALRESLAGKAIIGPRPDPVAPVAGLRMLSSGNGQAIMCWRNVVWQGRLAGLIKRAWDRRFIESLDLA